MLADPAPNYGDRSLYIGARCPRGRLRAGLFRWPWLVGVFADERGQDFQNCGVVPGRIVGDALWRVDAAEANVEFTGAELLDRLGAAVSHLPLFGEFDSAAQLRSPSCGEGSVRGQNPHATYPGQRPGRVLRFLPPGVEKASSEGRSAHSVAACTAAKMMCLPGHKGWKDRRAVRLVAAARPGQRCPVSASA